MSKKYEFIGEPFCWEGVELRRIRALADIPGTSVKAGDVGGFLQSESNLSHQGSCWVYDEAKVYNEAVVKDDASVRDDATVSDTAGIEGNATIYELASVYGDASIRDNAKIYGSASVHGETDVFDNAKVYGFAEVSEKARIFEHAEACGSSNVRGTARLCGNAKACADAVVGHYAVLSDGEIKTPRDYLCVGPLGSRNAFTTLNLRTGTVCTGCFEGNLDKFEAAVRSLHGPSRLGLQYQRVIKMFREEFYERSLEVE